MERGRVGGFKGSDRVAATGQDIAFLPGLLRKEGAAALPADLPEAGGDPDDVLRDSGGGFDQRRRRQVHGIRGNDQSDRRRDEDARGESGAHPCMRANACIHA